MRRPRACSAAIIRLGGPGHAGIQDADELYGVPQGRAGTTVCGTPADGRHPEGRHAVRARGNPSAATTVSDRDLWRSIAATAPLSPLLNQPDQLEGVAVWSERWHELFS